MPEEIKDPQQDNPQEDPKKDSSSEEQSKQTHIETNDDLPEKFKGKSASDIAKSYLELEKKLGEGASSSRKLSDEVEQWRKLGEVIQADPELTAAVRKKVGADTAKESNNNADSDTRNALTDKIVTDFEKDYGIDRLTGEKRGTLYEAIGKELADMLDPTGKKSTKEILDSINLTRLPQYLGKAYKLATMGDESEQARIKGIMQARQNSEGEFSSMPSQSSKSDSTSLSEDERAVAKKLGITEEKYLEQKKKLN